MGTISTVKVWMIVVLAGLALLACAHKPCEGQQGEIEMVSFGLGSEDRQLLDGNGVYLGQTGNRYLDGPPIKVMRFVGMRDSLLQSMVLSFDIINSPSEQRTPNANEFIVYIAKDFWAGPLDDDPKHRPANGKYNLIPVSDPATHPPTKEGTLAKIPLIVEGLTETWRGRPNDGGIIVGVNIPAEFGPKEFEMVNETLTVTELSADTGMSGFRYIEDFEQGIGRGAMICPKTGRRFPADEAVVDGYTGLLVHPSAFDPAEPRQHFGPADPKRR